MSDIDIIITWVDGEDKAWIDKKNIYSKNKTLSTDDGVQRYRDMGTLKYLFRGIENNMPWVNRIFFITEGHLPSWINVEAKKLKIVNHSDYIPKEYLPTFNSHTIELNFHRIKELSNKFIYFNDDMFPINPISKDEFFCKGIPVGLPIITPLVPDETSDFKHILINNMKVINTNFSMKEVMKKNKCKWFSYKCGKDILRNIIFSFWPVFLGFKTFHMPIPFVKETFREVWEKEYDVMHETSMHKFRDYSNVNPWLIQYWQYMKGDFYPKKNKGIYLSLSDVGRLREVLNGDKYNLLCLNDDEKVTDFEKNKKNVCDLFEKKLPVKSKYEL